MKIKTCIWMIVSGRAWPRGAFQTSVGPSIFPSCASNPHTNSRTGGWISRKVLAHGMAYTAAACKIAGRTSHECADRCKRTRPGKAQAFGEDAQPHMKAPAGMGFPPGLSALRHINKKLIFCCSSSPGTRLR